MGPLTPQVFGRRRPDEIAAPPPSRLRRPPPERCPTGRVCYALSRVIVRQPALSGPAGPLRRRGDRSMLRSRLNRTVSPVLTPASAGAPGYKSLSATAVPARPRLRPSPAACYGPDCARGLRPMTARPQGLRLARARRRWAEAPAEPRRLGRLSVNAFGAVGLRAPRCLPGGFVQLGSM